MRIGILADPLDFQRGGIYYYTVGLIKGLMAIEPAHEIILIRAKEDHLYDFPQIAIPQKFAILGYDVKRKFMDIPKALQRSAVDIVFEPAHFGPFNLPKSIKRVTMIHDLTPIYFPQWHPWKSSLLQRLFLRRILRRADLILTNSKHTAQDVEKYLRKTSAKIKTIHLGLSREFHMLDVKNVPKPSIIGSYILFVSTIEPRKNLFALLKAFEEYKKITKNSTKLVICGEVGWKAKRIMDSIATHVFSEDIICTKYVDREYLISLYTHAETFVYPSQYEGFGLPVIEALACGIPVIAARNSSIPEIGQEFVQYFETNDVGQLSELLIQSQRIIDTPDIEAQRIEYAKSYSWESYAHSFLHELEQL